MDLHRYAAMRRLWRRSPPLQQMVQAYLGIQPADSPAPAAAVAELSEDEVIRNFMSNFAAAGGNVQ